MKGPSRMPSLQSSPDPCVRRKNHHLPGSSSWLRAPVADAGLAHFGALKANAEELVERMRASNLPGWLKNQTLNTLVNLATNSMYKKDGRVAFAEGQWTCFGTMDQMWHARQIVGQLLPFFAWEELRYWARTQMKSGQIHHDTNRMDVGADRALNAIAAHSKHQGDLVVIDAGSAITVDVVSRQAEFLGGVILPGDTRWLDPRGGRDYSVCSCCTIVSYTSCAVFAWFSAWRNLSIVISRLMRASA